MKEADNFRQTAIRILHYAHLGVSRYGFYRQISKILLQFCECDSVRFIAEDGNFLAVSEVRSDEKTFKLQYYRADELSELPDDQPDKPEPIWLEVLSGTLDDSHPNKSINGCLYYTGDEPFPELNSEDSDYRTILALPFVINDHNNGLLILQSVESKLLNETSIALYGSFAQNIGSAIAARQTRSECHERVKELTCLYGINNLARNPKIKMNDLLKAIASLLPPAWQYPYVTIARVNFDGLTYSTDEFNNPPHIQTAEIVIDGEVRGSVEVAYTVPQPEIYEGPFLREERDLINTVADQVSKEIKRIETEDYRIQLQDQLRHSDRLATLGQLSAGIAHELNEPLGAILGFSQLAVKTEGLPDSAKKDLERIITSSLHAREVVKKLLSFARQTPTGQSDIDLNNLIKNGLYLLEARIAKEDIELFLDIAPDLPLIKGDSAQIHQVLVNLVVNAMQSMSNGGKLQIGTKIDGNNIILIVTDTGTGMTKDILEKIFMPFFTTKDPDLGTGLGLAVAQSIVASHGGSIDVFSTPGKGSEFRVKFPVNDDHGENRE